MDRVELTDLTDTTVAFSFLGPQSTQLLKKSELPNSKINLTLLTN